MIVINRPSLYLPILTIYASRRQDKGSLLNVHFDVEVHLINPFDRISSSAVERFVIDLNHAKLFLTKQSRLEFIPSPDRKRTNSTPCDPRSSSNSCLRFQLWGSCWSMDSTSARCDDIQGRSSEECCFEYESPGAPGTNSSGS